MGVEMILSVQLFATTFMCGVIWFVQIVHYPLMASVGREQFASYEGRHQQLTSCVVAPVMLVELMTSALFLWQSSEATRAQAVISLTLIAVIWTSTFLLQVPAHQSLSLGFSAAAQRKLVRTNWIRTAAWTIRVFLLLSLTQQGR